MQQNTYPDEFDKLLDNKDINKGSKIIALNSAFNGKQLICIRDRVNVSEFFADSNHQIIISRHYPIANLIIKHIIYIQEQSKHCPPFVYDFGYQLLVSLFDLL